MCPHLDGSVSHRLTPNITTFPHKKQNSPREPIDIMVKVLYRLITLVTALRLTVGVACMPEGGATASEYEISATTEVIEGQRSGSEWKSNEVIVASDTGDLKTQVLETIEIVFLLFNLLFLGSAMHDWVGPVPPKAPRKGKEPYKISLEM